MNQAVQTNSMHPDPRIFAKVFAICSSNKFACKTLRCGILCRHLEVLLHQLYHLMAPNFVPKAHPTVASDPSDLQTKRASQILRDPFSNQMHVSFARSHFSQQNLLHTPHLDPDTGRNSARLSSLKYGHCIGMSFTI